MNQRTLEALGIKPGQYEEAQRAGAGLYPGRVTEQHREHYRVMTAEGDLQAEVSGRFAYLAEGPEDYPAVGDWVLVDRQTDDGGVAVIHRMLSRFSCFSRRAAGTAEAEQVIAANIDRVFVCMALTGDFNLRRLERYLAAIRVSGAEPVAVLTKSDLCRNLEAQLAEVRAVASGAEVVVTSGLLEDGLEALKPYLLPGDTVAFAGSSGVGKSTLINRLLGGAVQSTGETRKDDRGRHVTTSRQLFLLPEGGIVIDTPGMRELQLSGGDLTGSFPEVEALAGHCRFADCTHQEEPGCAVRKALEEGRLSPDRLRSYEKLQKELQDVQRRSSLGTSRAEKEKVVRMMGSLKTLRKIQKTNPKSQRQ